MVDLAFIIQQAKVGAREASVVCFHTRAFTTYLNSAVMRYDLLFNFKYGLLPG